MRRSNRKFNIPSPPPPPPGANPGHLTISVPGWGKLNRKCQVSNTFFSGAEVANIYKTLDEMEELKGRDVAFVSDWLTKKVLKKSLLKTAGADDECSLVGYDRQIRR